MLELPGMYDHVSVCVENHLIVFGGLGENYEIPPLHNIWMYNVQTEQWGKHVIPDEKLAPPGTSSACAVAIAGDIYMFGGLVLADDNLTNAVWKLTRTSQQCFEWRKGMERNKNEMPSPRHYHTGWEYTGELWTFGGSGELLADYLDDHGDFAGKENNQLLCYNPKFEEWRNPKSLGTVPGPRSCHATAIIGDKVWLYGGFGINLDICNELYQLNMVSLAWTEVQSGQVKPPFRDMFSLNAITENELLLYGGESLSVQSLNDSWLFDLVSLSWKKYEATRGDPRSNHTGTACMDNNVIIIGGEWYDMHEDGYRFQKQVYSDIFSLRLEPKRLQKLAIQKIYQNRDVLPWELLPNSLKALFLFPVTDADRDERCEDAAKKQTYRVFVR